MHKRPNFCHTPTLNDSLETSKYQKPTFLTNFLNNKPDVHNINDVNLHVVNVENQSGNTRERLLPVSESDSDCENSVKETQYKIVTLSKKDKPSITVEDVAVSNGVIPNNRIKKTDAVVEKEKQMRFLREKYPSLESMAIHNILSKHNFNIEDAIKELELKSSGDKPEGSSVEKFNYWKATQENNEQVPPSSFKKRMQTGEFSNATKNKGKAVYIQLSSFILYCIDHIITQKAQNTFECARIFPYNDNKFNEADFASATVTDDSEVHQASAVVQALPSTSNEAIVDPNNIPRHQTPPPGPSNDWFNLLELDIVCEDGTVSPGQTQEGNECSTDLAQIANASVTDILPLPCIEGPVNRHKIRCQKSEIFSNTPFKKKLVRIIEERESKQASRRTEAKSGKCKLRKQRFKEDMHKEI
ncbi:hypothetical protein FQA39_LY01440 [Lamprigera yunnana]|nr:hypothetical protein FQA39_LY01440 [Lamprigera yunnana]